MQPKIRATNYTKQEKAELKGETEKSMIIFGYFHNLLSRTEQGERKSKLLKLWATLETNLISSTLTEHSGRQQHNTHSLHLRKKANEKHENNRESEMKLKWNETENCIFEKDKWKWKTSYQTDQKEKEKKTEITSIGNFKDISTEPKDKKRILCITWCQSIEPI